MQHEDTYFLLVAHLIALLSGRKCPNGIHDLIFVGTGMSWCAGSGMVQVRGKSKILLYCSHWRSCMI